ncbi:MAG: hypothetical protein Q9217_000559 [Psora testacea]
MGRFDGKQEETVSNLNRSLHILTTVFPHILPEVFREMLLHFSGESRLQIVVDQLLKHRDKWVRGRWRTASSEAQIDVQGNVLDSTLLAAEDEFRRASYAWAVKRALYQEFNTLNKSKIDAVLAEENFSYSRARPTLQKLASKGWKVAIKTFWSAWRKPATEEIKSHPMLAWTKSDRHDVAMTPALRETGDVELDMELNCTVLAPLLDRFKAQQEEQDQAAAESMNEEEARKANAMYECCCCFGDVTFEQLATCSSGHHIICFRCVRHAVSEALFGQGWVRNIDHVTGQVRCVAVTSQEGCCEGSLAQPLARRAIVRAKGGIETWKKFETRFAEEALSKANIPLINCPFCNYAEVDELYLPRQLRRYRPQLTDIRSTFLLLILTLNLLPFLILYALLYRFPLFSTLPPIPTLFATSLARLSRSRHLPMRFQCRMPSCRQPSCLRCFKVWRDPHTCHESATLSLRTTIETARTSALKRTCPKCGLAFVKDSGCNKLTCVCGYTMCYICRLGLGKGDGSEGYRHFCQHFRPQGGACRECAKCDLYKDSDDDDRYIKEAGAKAEQKWREREGMVGVTGLNGDRIGAEKQWPQFGWNLQDIMDCSRALRISLLQGVHVGLPMPPAK